MIPLCIRSVLSSLKARTIKNVSYVGLSEVIIVLLNIATLMVLSRLLTPEDFGLYGVAMVFLILCYSLQDMGILPAVIQRDTRIEDSIRVGLGLRLLIAVVLASGIIILSPVLADYFGDTRLEMVLSVISVNLFILPVGFGAQVLLTRSLRFGRLAFASIIQHSVLACVSIVSALAGYGYWSLVFGSLAGSMALVSTLIYYERTMLRPKFDRFLAGELMGFGKHLLITGLFVYLITNVDQFAVGGVMGVTALGIYVVTVRLGRAIGSQMSGTVNRVLFPTMARIKNDMNRLWSGYSHSLRMISLIAAPTCMGMSAVSPILVDVVLGEEWLLVVMPLSIISFQGLLNSLIPPAANVLISIGKPHFMSAQTVIQAIIIVVGIYPVTSMWGIEGVCYFTTFVSLGVFVYFIIVFSRLFSRHLSEIVRPILPSLASGAVMFVIVRYLAGLMLSSWVSLMILMGLMVIIYFSTLWILSGSKEIREVINILRILLGKTVDERGHPPV